MSLPKHIDAYLDCFEYFEAALQDALGARVQFEAQGEANLFMLRLHQARALKRDEMQRLYPRDDIRWGRSEYDRLVVRRPREDEEGKWWVYIEHVRASVLTVQRISNLEDIETDAETPVVLDREVG